MDKIGSNRFRDNIAGVLSEVEHDGAHFTVMRYRKPAAVLVPVGWYEQARAALGYSPGRSEGDRQAGEGR